MRKFPVFIGVTTSLILSSCSTINSVADRIPNVLDGTSLIYRPTILQGNVVTPQQIQKLQMGMSPRQVRFILGTSTLKDTFHANRWDYNYTKGIGSTPDEIHLLSVYFADNKLVRVDDTGYPTLPPEQVAENKPTVVKVPDWETEETSFWKFW